LPADAEQATFIKGQNLYNQGLYHQATAVFGDFLKAYPNSLVKDLALLWLGRSYMRVGDVPAAEQIGMRLREIPDTPFVSIYEEELRAARQSYVRAALPSVKVEPSSVAVESPKSLATKLPTPLPTSSPIITSALSKTSARDESLAKETAQGRLSSIEKNQKPKVDEVINAAPDIAPRVRIRMEQSTRETAASNAVFYRLVISNEGKGTARELIVSELLSESSQFASSNPAPARQDPVARTQRLTFRVVELKPGESRTLSIAVRPRNVGSSTDNILKTKHSVSYQDSQGKTYQND